MGNLLIEIYEDLFRAGVSRPDALAVIAFFLSEINGVKSEDQNLFLPDLTKFEFYQNNQFVLWDYFESNAKANSIKFERWLQDASVTSKYFEELLNLHFEKEKDRSRKRTPLDVKTFFDAFIKNIIDTSGFHAIIDLAVGSGRLLKDLPRELVLKSNYSILGLDIDRRAGYISQAFLNLNNADIAFKYYFKQYNSIADPSLISEIRGDQPSIFIFDPPMSEVQPLPSQWDLSATDLFGKTGKINSELLFLVNILLHAPNKSWYIGLFPENITFDSSKIYQNIRKYLISSGLRFVVKLPTSSPGRILLVGQKEPASIIKAPSPILLFNFNQVPPESHFELLFHALNSSERDLPEPLQEVCQFKKWKVEELLKKNIFEMPLPPLLYQIPQLSPAEIFLKLEPLEENIQKRLESLKSALLETKIKVDEKVFISIKPPPTPFQSWKENIADSALKEVLENLETCLDRDGFISWKPTLALSNFSQYLKTLFELGFLIKEQETEPPSHWKLKIATEQQPLISSHSFLDFLLPPAWEPTENLKTLVGFLPKTQYEFYKNLFQDWLFRENNFPELERSISDIQVFEELGLIKSLPKPTPLSISIPELGEIVFVHPFFGSQWETVENDPDGHFGEETGSGAGFIDGTGVG